MSDGSASQANWLHLLWIGVAYFIQDLRTKLRGKASKEQVTAGENSLREALKADREACETARNGVDRDVNDHEVRLRSIEAESATVKALATNVGNLADSVERLADKTDEHHKQNRIDAATDRDKTEDWRTNVMGPLLKQLGEQSAANAAEIKALKERDEDKEERLRELEQRRARRKS